MNKQQIKDGAVVLINTRLDAVEQQQGKAVRDFVDAMLEAHHRAHLIIMCLSVLDQETHAIAWKSLVGILDDYTKVMVEKLLPANTTHERVDELLGVARDIHDAYVQYVDGCSEQKAA